MKNLIITPIHPSAKTMSSIQLHGIIFTVTGKYKELFTFHRHLEIVLNLKDDTDLVSSILDARGYVLQYNLTEVQANMVMASIDYKHLELITKVFVHAKNQSESAKPLTGLEYAKALVVAEEGLSLEKQEHNATKVQLEKKAIQLDESKEWISIKRMAKLMGTHWRDYSWHKLKPIHAIKKTFDSNYGSINVYHYSAWIEAYPNTAKLFITHECKDISEWTTTGWTVDMMINGGFFSIH
jgi:hypothetical protein